MSEALEHRIKFLEQKTTVMAQEFSQVLGEMQQTIVSILGMHRMAADVTSARLDVIERKLGIHGWPPSVSAGSENRSNISGLPTEQSGDLPGPGEGQADKS